MRFEKLKPISEKFHKYVEWIDINKLSSFTCTNTFGLIILIGTRFSTRSIPRSRHMSTILWCVCVTELLKFHRSGNWIEKMCWCGLLALHKGEYDFMLLLCWVVFALREKFIGPISTVNRSQTLLSACCCVLLFTQDPQVKDWRFSKEDKEFWMN